MLLIPHDMQQPLLCALDRSRPFSICEFYLCSTITFNHLSGNAQVVMCEFLGYTGITEYTSPIGLEFQIPTCVSSSHSLLCRQLNMYSFSKVWR